MPLLFAVTLFISASLLFMVQPMVGKMVLPLLGGSPAVWNACMVFFQALLLLGYLYAHWLTTNYRTRKQWAIHTTVLGAPILVMAFAALLSIRHSPIAIAESLAPSGDTSPFLSVMALLTIAIGIPFFVSSTSAPLIQKWFADTGHPSARDPYFLYAASNAGSLISLLGYPLVIEPNLSVVGQTWLWAVGFVVLAGFIMVCGSAAANPIAVPPSVSKQSTNRMKTTDAPPVSVEPPPALWRKVKWVALAFVPSSLMLGVTFHMTTDIASIPLLWVGPLALYLLTFIIAFSTITPPWFRLIIGNLAPVMILLLVFVLISGATSQQVGLTLLLHLATYFAAALMCHYELARDRPGTEHLTGYFLLMSVGGVLGGLFNALFAPLVFAQDYEYKLALVFACFMVPRLTPSAPSDDPPTPDARWFREYGTTFAVTLAIFAAVGGLGYLIVSRTMGVELWYVVAVLVGWALVGLWATVPKRLDPARRNPSAPPSFLTSLAIRSRGTNWAAVLDAALPVTVGVAFQILYRLSQVDRFQQTCKSLAGSLTLTTETVLIVVVFAIPVMVCFFFVDRPVRFGLCVATILGMSQYRERDRDLIHSERSFFGILKVEEHSQWQYPPISDEDGKRIGSGKIVYRRLVHGTTLHGTQIRTLENNIFDYFQVLPGTPTSMDGFAVMGAIQSFNAREEPLTYYHRTGPVGAMFHELRTRKNGADAKAHVAMVGLGTGSVSCYALPGQKLTFYEIDPAVKSLVADTDEYFTYVKDAERRGATLDFLMGDARLKLKENSEARYSLLLVDAFSSDSIPVHLLTKEAVQLYFDRMTEDGILALHISNKFVRLEPVVAQIAAELGVPARVWNDDGEGKPGKTASSWVVLARKPEYLGRLGASQPDQVERFVDADAPLLKLYRRQGPQAKLIAAIRRDYAMPKAHEIHGSFDEALTGLTSEVWDKLVAEGKQTAETRKKMQGVDASLKLFGDRIEYAIELMRHYRLSAPLKLVLRADTSSDAFKRVEELRRERGADTPLAKVLSDPGVKAEELRPLLKARGDTTTLQQVWEDLGGPRVELIREWVARYGANDPEPPDEKTDPEAAKKPVTGTSLQAAILFEFGPYYMDLIQYTVVLYGREINVPAVTLENAMVFKHGQMFRPVEQLADVPAWTDDYSDVLRVMMIPELQKLRKFMGLKTPVER